MIHSASYFHTITHSNPLEQSRFKRKYSTIQLKSTQDYLFTLPTLIWTYLVDLGSILFIKCTNEYGWRHMQKRLKITNHQQERSKIQNNKILTKLWKMHILTWTRTMNINKKKNKQQENICKKLLHSINKLYNCHQ